MSAWRGPPLQAGDEVLVYETGVAFYIIAKVVPV